MNTFSKRPRRRAGRRRGFSLIELLVAIIIIGILVVILLPVVGNRTAQARIARANSDLESLSEAQQRVEVDTQFYVRLFVLNDSRSVSNVTFQRPTPPAAYEDGLGQYLGGAQFFQNELQVFIQPEIGDLVTAVRGQNILTKLTTETSYDPVNPYNWNGPYINWQRDENLYAGLVAPDGIPDDPWGNNYLLFTNRGMVLEPNGVIVASTSPLSSGGFSSGGSFDASRFDRPAIVSLGPDGLPGDGILTFGNGDDLVRYFGR